MAVKIRTLAEQINFTLYKGIGVCAFAGTEIYLDKPKTALFSLAASYVTGIGTHLIADHYSTDISPKAKAREFPLQSVILLRAADNFSHVLKMKDVPELSIVQKKMLVKLTKEEKEALSGSDRIKYHVKELFWNYANAFALGTVSRNAITFTEHLLDKLNPREELFVLGHEMGHLAGRHSARSKSYFGSAARTLAALNFVGVMFSSLANVGITAASMFVSNRTTQIMKDVGYNPKNEFEKKVIKNTAALTTDLTLVAGAWITDQPAIAAAYVLTRATKFSMSLVQAAYHRSNEFQADRIGVELTGDSYAIASGLHKIAAFNKIAAIEDGKIPAKTTTLHKSYMACKTFLLGTHPSLRRRIAAANRHARSLGLKPTIG